MKRRSILLGGVAALLGLGAAGVVRSRATAGELTIDAALRRIDALAAADLRSTGAWTPHQIFSHCAQTVEYSISGYPAAKSAVFQHTAGAAAFAVFSAAHRMKHGLSTPIEGAPAIADDAGGAEHGLQRLRKALVDFQRFDGTPAPHFAYGALMHAEYEAAHVMHFWNHLEEIHSTARA